MKKFFFINSDVDPSLIFGSESECCLDAHEIRRLSGDGWPEFDELMEMFHEASQSEIDEFGVYDSEYFDHHIFRDNAGRLHFAVLDKDNTCVYYLVDTDEELIRSTREDLWNGGDPVADAWEGGEEDPQTCYNTMRAWIEARNGSAEEIDDSEI